MDSCKNLKSQLKLRYQELDFSEEQNINALLEMVLTPFNIKTVSSEEHEKNADVPIDDTVPGIVIAFNELHSVKALSSIRVTPVEIVTSVNEVHCLNTTDSITLILPGIKTVFNDVHH